MAVQSEDAEVVAALIAAGDFPVVLTRGQGCACI